MNQPASLQFETATLTRRPRRPLRWSVSLLAFALLVLSLMLPHVHSSSHIVWAQESAADSDDLPTRSPSQAVPSWRQASNVAIITIEGGIDQVTVSSVERRLQLAKQQGADGVVFEIDTFGGSAAAALELCEIIKGSPIPNTTAWIRPKAYSAGTLIALACNEIIITPNASIGDCAPILPGRVIPTAERAKIESPLLEEVMDSARLHGYDEKLVVSFIAVDMELWLIRNKDTGRYRFVDRKEYQFLFDGDEPPEGVRTLASKNQPPTNRTSGPRRGFERFISEHQRRLSQRQGNNQNPDEPYVAPSMSNRMAEAGMQLTTDSVAIPLTDDDVGHYEYLEPVISSSKLLVLKRGRAIDYGLAINVISNDEELKAFKGASNMSRYHRTWSESLVRFLTSGMVRAFLLLIFVVGLLWEMATPGVGVPGAFAACSLTILLGAPALTGLAQWWDILFVLSGILLIIVEVFVIPGFGIAGIAGVILLALGFIGTFIAPDPSGGLLPSSPLAQQQGMNGLLTLMVGFFGTAVTVYFVSRHFESLPFFSKLVLTAGNTSTTANPPTMLQSMQPTDDSTVAIGDSGRTVTTLRPGGRARFGGKMYDVVSSRGLIEADEAVVVRAIEDLNIVVERETSIEEQSSSS